MSKWYIETALSTKWRKRLIKIRFIPGMKPSLKEESLVTWKTKEIIEKTGGKALLIPPLSLKASLIIFIHSSKSSGDLCLVTSCKMDESSWGGMLSTYSVSTGKSDSCQMMMYYRWGMLENKQRGVLCYMVKQCVYCSSKGLGLQVSNW